ncbi:MAG: hypothetical protein HON94_02310, partial [Methylococcales bacterium]|nr:hypothetical protein [Methylococcales bacterium]
MNVLQRFYFIILLCYPTIVYSNDLQIFTDISSLTYSGSVPIKAYTDDWKTEDFQQSDFAFSFNQATVGVKYKNWSLAWLSRYDYWLEFSEDTAELYYKTQNDQDLDANRQYQLSLEIGHQISQGWRASYEWFFNKNNSLTMAISWLKANWLIDGKINGQAVATNINDYGFDLAVDYLYSEDRLFDRVNYTEPEGHGFAVDIGLNYAVTNRWSINLFIKDAFAEIQWKNAPQTIADATTNVSIRNLDGSLNVRPIIQG